MTDAEQQDFIEKLAEALSNANGSNSRGGFSNSNKYDNLSASELTEKFQKEQERFMEKVAQEEERSNMTRRERRKLLEEENERLDEQNERLKEIEENEQLSNEERINAHNELVANQEKQYQNERRINSERRNGLDIVQGILKVVGDFNTPFAKAEDAASKYTKALGGTKAAMDALRKSTVNNVAKSKLGIDYNVSPEELIKLQENYVKGVGRNIKLGNAEQESISAMHAVYQGGEVEMATMFDKFGVGIEGTSKHLGKMFTDASKSGISLDKYADNVKKGLAMAQTYTFTGGLRSMERMAQRAAAIRMDMAQVQHMADSLDSVEKSITTAAKMQVLGGSFAAAADPLGMLRESLMDPEELQKRMENITASIGTFNKATGEVEIGAFDRMRLKEYANATGQDFGQLMEQTRRQAQMGEIRSQISSSANAAGLSEEMKKLIENTAIFQDGKAGVSINGEFRSIDDLSNDDYEELVKETQSESEDIKDIAKNLRSLVDKREGARKQKEAVQAKISTPFAKMEGFLQNILGRFNFFLGLWIAYTTASNLAGVFGARGGIGRKAISKIKGKNGGKLGSANSIKGFLGRNITSSTGKSYKMIGGQLINADGKVISGAARDAILKNGTTQGRIGSVFSNVKTGISNLGKNGMSAVKNFGKGVSNVGKNGVGVTKNLGTNAGKGLLTAGKTMSSAARIGGGVAAGVLGGLFTGIDEFKGQNNHSTKRKIGATAGSAIGGTIGAIAGSFLGPLGTVVGGFIGEKLGKWVGSGFANDKRRAKFKDKYGLTDQLQGDYSVKEIKEINKARVTGKISKKLMDKLANNGDMSMFEQINNLKKEEAAKKEEKRNKRHEMFMGILGAGKQKFGVANFEVGVANFSGRGITKNTLSPISILRGVKEKGLRASWEAVKSGESALSKQRRKAAAAAQGSNGSINVNINGTLRLEGGNGQSVDVLAEIKRNPVLLSQLTDMIIKKMNTDTYGGYRSDRTLGNNIPA